MTLDHPSISYYSNVFLLCQLSIYNLLVYGRNYVQMNDFAICTFQFFYYYLFSFFFSRTALSFYEEKVGVHVRINMINKKSFLAIKCLLGILLVFMGMVNSFCFVWVHVLLHRMGIFLFKTDMRDGNLFLSHIPFTANVFQSWNSKLIFDMPVIIWQGLSQKNNRCYLFVRGRRLILWLPALNVRWLERATQITFQNNISYKSSNRW